MTHIQFPDVAQHVAAESEEALAHFRTQGVSMSERLALKGDKTTTGGSILGPSSSWYNEDGRAFALAEDLATCGNCKGSWRVGGTARHWMDEGAAMVKDLDRVYCPCGKNRVLASGSSPFFYSTDNDTAEAAQSTTLPRTHDEQFTLSDAAGNALADTYYTVRLASGELKHGVTDSSGRTDRYETDGSRSIYFYVGHR